MKQPNSKSNKSKLYVIVAILAITSLAYRLISEYEFEQTSVLFVGIPTLITLLMIRYSGTPKSAYGIVFKVITLFLLMSSILLGEGIVCILFAAPIFYGVSALIIFVYQTLEERHKSKMNSIVIIPVIIILAMPFGIKSEPELQSVQTSAIIQNGISLEALNKLPDFESGFPGFFKLGFPKPLDIKGAGIKTGDIRNIRFKSNTKGIGTLALKVSDRDEESITFSIIQDDTHINHWLTWKNIKVKLIPLDNKQTKVVWTSNYVCDLGPNWYFEPLEKYAVGLMNEHLITSYFK